MKSSFFRNNFFVLLLFAIMNIFGFSSTAEAQSTDEKDIVAVMRQEEAYWNEGDIEGYVSLYAPGDSARMILTDREAYGRDSILAFYKKYWPKDKMGQLKLDGEKLELISSDCYFVTGFFHVKMVSGKMINGRYSSLMKKINGKWYIYTDHSA